MAQHKSAAKRARQATQRQVRNTMWKSRMRTAIKKVLAAKDRATAEVDLKKTIKLLDQLAARGVIHRNKAANQKSALTLYVNKLS